MTEPMDLYAPFQAGAGADVTESMWRAFMHNLRDDGVIATKSYPPEAPNELEVYGDSSGMQVKVLPGEVWIRAHWGAANGEVALPVGSAHSTLVRIDRVVARANFLTNVVEFDVVTGVPDAVPTAAALTQNTAVWEIPLAQVTVDPQVTVIAAGDVVDERRRVGLGLFNHYEAPLWHEGDFGSLGKTPVDLGASGQGRCRWFRMGQIVHIRYDFQWEPEGGGSTDRGRVYTDLPRGMVSADEGPHRLWSHLWTHTPTDRDWIGTSLIDANSRYVFPFFSRGENDARITWYRIQSELGGGAGSGYPYIPSGYPKGGALTISGHLEVK